MIKMPSRVFSGCVAGAISVLVFHQTTLQIFFWLGLTPQAAFRIAHVPPFNAPMVVSITFWGALYGAMFARTITLVKTPSWANGLAAGFVAMLLSWFVVRPLAGNPMAFGWLAGPMFRSFCAYEMWGLGVAMILPALVPRSLTARAGGAPSIQNLAV
jgi:hypothetical protein